MGKTATVAKYAVNVVLVMMVVGVVLTAFSVVDLAGGVAHVGIPADLYPAGQAIGVDSGVLGAGSIALLTGSVWFDAPLLSLSTLLFALSVLAQVIPAFAILLILRKIIATVAAGNPFDDRNVGRMRAIGALTITFWFFYGAVMFGLKTLLSATSTVSGFHLSAAGEWNLYVFLLGVVIIGLAEVFRYGIQLQSDVDLTV